MGLNLRKIRDAAFAQINPFDGGKTANTVWNNTPVGYKDQSQTIRPTGISNNNGTIYINQQARQASQARPQQSFIPGNQKKPSGFMGALNAAIDSPLSPVSVGKEVFLGNGPLGYLGKATSTGPLAKPTQGIRDTLFDANTAKDIAKRNQAELAKAQMAKANGQVYTPKLNQTYMEQQASLGRRGRNNFGDQMVGGFAENLNTVGAKLYETPETLRGTVAASTGNQEALRMSLERQKKNAQMLYGKNSGGLLNTGTIYDSPEQTMNLSAGDTAKRVFGGQLEAASMVVGGGALPSIAKSGLKGLASYGGKTFASGAMGLGGNEMSTNPNASAMDIVKQSALGGVFGLGLGVAGDAAVKGVGMGVKAIKPKVELTKVNQQGSIDPAQAFKNIRDKLNGSALDTTVKPATPENVYGTNPLEKIGKKFNQLLGTDDQGGFVANPFYKDGTMRPGVKKDQIFDGVDGKPRVEFDDSVAKIANPNGQTLGEVLDHPVLYKQYPELAQTPVRGLKSNRGEIASMDLSTGVLHIDPRRIDASNLLHEIQHKIQGLEKFTNGTNPQKAADIKRAKILETLDPLAAEYNAQARAWKAKETEVLAKFGKNSPEYQAVAKEGAMLTKTPLYKQVIKLNRENNRLAKNGDYDGYKKNAGEAESRAVEARLNMTPDERAKTPFYNSLDVPKEDLIIRNGGGKAMSLPKNPLGKDPQVGKTDPTRAQALNKVAVAASEAPKMKTPNDLLAGGTDETLAAIDARNKLMAAKAGMNVEQKTPPAKPVVKAAPPTKPNVVKSSTPEDVLQRAISEQDAMDASSLKYKGAGAVRAKGRDVSEKIYNPYSHAEKLSHDYAKATGETPDAVNNLAHMMDKVANSDIGALELRKQLGGDKLIQKYKPGSDAEREVNFYRVAKRALDVSEGKKKQVLGGYTNKELEDFVASYEVKNPSAVQDLNTMMNIGYQMQKKFGVDTGLITDAHLNNVANGEKYYTPIQRVKGPSDNPRATVNARNKASVSSQKVIQTLKGDKSPVDFTWKWLEDVPKAMAKQGRQNETGNLLYKMISSGKVPQHGKVLRTPEQSKAIRWAGEKIQELANTATKAKTSIKLASKDLRKNKKAETAAYNKAEDNAIKDLAKAVSNKHFDDGLEGNKFADVLLGMNRTERRQLVDGLDSWFRTGDINRGIVKSGKVQSSLDALTTIKKEHDAILDEVGGLKKSRTQLVNETDSRNRPVIHTLVDGELASVEVTPNLAAELRGIGDTKLSGPASVSQAIQKPFREAWTGALNPIFNIKSKLLYDPAMMIVNQKGALRTLGNPMGVARVAKEGFVGNFKSTKFAKELKADYGISPATASRLPADPAKSLKEVAAQKNLWTRLAYYSIRPGKVVKVADIPLGQLQHGSRMMNARIGYERVFKATKNHKAAMEQAAYDYNNILPNYARTTKALREIDAFIPYSNAGVAGTRAITTGMKASPVGAPVKMAALTSAIASAEYLATQNPATAEFYQDMYDTRKNSTLNNNIIVALPNAHKVKPEEAAASGGKLKEGEWDGIIKIPIPPELRSGNAIVQQAIAKKIGVDTGKYNPTIGAVTSGLTGGIASVGRNGDISSEFNPGWMALGELTTDKQNISGDNFAYGDAALGPRNERVNPNTSQLAVKAAQGFNKLPIGDISPAALDAQLKNFGAFGNVVRSVGSGLTKDENTSPDRLPKVGFIENAIGQISAKGTKGMTDTSWHFKNQKTVMDGLTSSDRRREFETLNSKSDSPEDAGIKATLLYGSLQNDGVLWNAQKKQNDLDAAKTGISNPLFDLSPEQARAVMLYRGNASLNKAKQTYSKDGSSLFQSLGLDEKWYQDFKGQESAYYDKIAAKTGKDSSTAKAAKTYSGQGYTEPSFVIQSKLDKYYTLPKGTGARTAFLKDNPDVTQYWDQQNALTNEERVAMGLDLLGDGGTDSNSYSKSGGYSKGGYSRRGGGSGGGGSGDGLASEYDNPYKYAVSIKAKGSSKATVKLGGKIAKRGVTAKATSKPKVTIKKSTA